jgi:hypothetical protein
VAVFISTDPIAPLVFAVREPLAAHPQSCDPLHLGVIADVIRAIVPRRGMPELPLRTL